MALDDVTQLAIRGQSELSKPGVSGALNGKSQPSWHGYGAGVRAPSSLDAIRRYSAMPRQAQMARAAGPGYAREAYNQLQAQIAELTGAVHQLQASGPGVLGGPVTYGNRERNLSPFVDTPMIGVGGILTTDAIVIPAAAAAGTTITGTFSGLQLAKLQGTVIELVSLVGPSELQQESEQMDLTVTINDRQFRTLDRIPTDLLFPTAMGEQQLIPAGVHVPSGALVNFEIRINVTLDTAAPHNMFGRVYAGNGADYRAWGQ